MIVLEIFIIHKLDIPTIYTVIKGSRRPKGNCPGARLSWSMESMSNLSISGRCTSACHVELF